MTKNTFENDLQGEEVRLKRYFYALRPALACRWILERRSVPPMEFHLLRAVVTDGGWQEAVDDLLVRKAAAAEKAMIAPVASLQTWIADTLVECKEKADVLLPNTHDTDDLDRLFRKTIGNPPL